MSGTGDQRANLVSDQGSYESYTVVTTSGSSDRASQGSYLRMVAAPARRSTAPDSTAVLSSTVTDSTAVLSNAAYVGGHMPSSTPDWSALASQNERLVTAMPPAPADGPPAAGPQAPPAAAAGTGPAAGACGPGAPPAAR